jgi:hypothetical protein
MKKKKRKFPYHQLNKKSITFFQFIYHKKEKFKQKNCKVFVKQQRIPVYQELLSAIKIVGRKVEKGFSPIFFLLVFESKKSHQVNWWSFS